MSARGESKMAAAKIVAFKSAKFRDHLPAKK